MVTVDNDDYVFYVLFIVVGFVSLVASMTVALTPVIFKVTRGRMFLRILAVMSFCDSLSSLGFVLDLARDFKTSYEDTPACKASGFFATFFVRASLTWTVALSSQLYSVVKYSKPYISEMKMHVICWSIPIVSIVIDLCVGSPFGQPNQEGAKVHFTYCAFKLANEVQLVVFSVIFNSMLVVYIIAILTLYLKTHGALEMRRGGSDNSYDKMVEVVGVMRLYPFAMIVCFLPHVITSIIESSNPSDENSVNLNNISCFISGLYGSVVACIFFYSSKDTRRRWRTLLLDFRVDNNLTPIEDMPNSNSFYNASSWKVELADSDVGPLSKCGNSSEGGGGVGGSFHVSDIEISSEMFVNSFAIEIKNRENGAENTNL
jgi:hypothetical protein